LTFTPHLVPVVRGMVSTISTVAKEAVTESQAEDVFKQYYSEEPFVFVLSEGDSPDMKHVVGSNQCHLAVRKDERTGRLQVVSVIDNLLKGASGQAVQVMNLISGLDETAGL